MASPTGPRERGKKHGGEAIRGVAAQPTQPQSNAMCGVAAQSFQPTASLNKTRVTFSHVYSPPRRHANRAGAQEWRGTLLE